MDLLVFCQKKNDLAANEWHDEYEYVNAQVNKGKNVDYGFQFDLPGAGAQWLIGKEDGDQLYNFADSGFTLAATITFDETHKNEELRPVLGVKIGENTKSVGVWCLKENMIIATENRETVNKVPSKTYVVKKKYQVALVYKSNKISVYIDWENFGDEQGFEINKGNQKELQFFFGNDKKHKSNVESDVTVTNVLLYNRPFDAGEIGKLKEYVKSVEVLTPPDQAVGTNTTGGNSDEPTTLPQGSTGEENKEEKAPSPSRTEDGGVGGGVRVFSLLLPLLCVSAPLLHL